MSVLILCDWNRCNEEVGDGYFEVTDSDFEGKPEGRKQFCTLACLSKWVDTQISIRANGAVVER